MHPGDLRSSPGMSRWNTSALSHLEPSMTSIAIIGAGAGLGAAVARRFGTEGFTGVLKDHAVAASHHGATLINGPRRTPRPWAQLPTHSALPS